MSRINKVIELLEQDQPVYYTGAGELSFDAGIRAARIWADYLCVDVEHGVFDLKGLDEFMRGLATGGPSYSGHRTPAVIVTLPIDGTSEQAIRSNSWMIKQVLARGVHGLLLCHVESAAAVRAFVESARYPYQQVGVGDTLGVGRRGSGGQAGAAHIWGIPVDEYLRRADPWPLNPEGELLLGLKIENRRALEVSEASTAVPGIAFAEWGPGDMGMSLGYPNQHDPPYPPDMIAARDRVKAACQAAGLFFLNSVTPQNVVEMITEGVRICSAQEQAATIGRRHTGRTMPW